MAALDEAIKAVVDAVDALEAAKAADVPVTVVDPVRAAVEGVLTSEGWTAPVVEVPEVVSEVSDPEDTAEVPVDVPA